VPDQPTTAARIDDLYRTDSRIILATLIRLLGDFDLAEEALQDAFVAAAEQWPKAGVPRNPRAWLISAGRFKTIDRLRRRARFDAALGELAMRLDEAGPDPAESGDEIVDDRLRLIFTCCHPALPPDAQVAMTLRELCGLTTEEIARAFMTSPPTVAQRIVRAKAKIRDARIPYEVPARERLPERLEVVLRVVYLVFTEGYAASAGPTLVRADLSGEAIRLGRLLVELLPDPETEGMLALMLLQESRRLARTDPNGELVLLPDQDRSRWDRALIDEGATRAERATSGLTVGPYGIQAAIAAVHATAPSTDATDWGRIVGLYDRLAVADPSPVVELNRAVAVTMAVGPAAGLERIDALSSDPWLKSYHLLPSVRGDVLVRLGRLGDARAEFERAAQMTRNARERALLLERAAACASGSA